MINMVGIIKSLIEKIEDFRAQKVDIDTLCPGHTEDVKWMNDVADKIEITKNEIHKVVTQVKSDLIFKRDICPAFDIETEIGPKYAVYDHQNNWIRKNITYEKEFESDVEMKTIFQYPSKKIKNKMINIQSILEKDLISTIFKSVGQILLDNQLYVIIKIFISEEYYEDFVNRHKDKNSIIKGINSGDD